MVQDVAEVLLHPSQAIDDASTALHEYQQMRTRGFSKLGLVVPFAGQEFACDSEWQVRHFPARFSPFRPV